MLKRTTWDSHRSRIAPFSTGETINHPSYPHSESASQSRGEPLKEADSRRFTHLAQVGVKSVRPNHDSSRSIVSWPLHRPASRPNPGCVPFRFEIRFLHAHGSAQVGLSPFYILTEHDTFSAHAITTCSPVENASEKADKKNWTFYDRQNCLKESAFSIRCSYLLCQNYVIALII